MAATIVTYGGGEILQQVFNAIAMLMNGGKNDIIRPLLVLGATIGGFWTVAKALFSPSLDAFTTKYLFPLIVASCCFCIPTTSVRVEDIVKDRSYKVDHVPLLIAQFAQLVSSIGYQITVAVETVMHVPNDLSYNTTGMIFGADTTLDTRRYKLTDPTLEQNLRRFSKQCVLYDVALGRYSIDELKTTADLWKLFEDKTSKVRMISYCLPGFGAKCTYLTCKDAVAQMRPLFEKQVDYYAKTDILGNLPLAFQALTGMKKDKENLIGQQLVMNALANEYNGNKFARSRAESQEQSTFQVVGGLASSSLISMRIVVEALIYIGFIFVLPLAVIPGGFKLIYNWGFTLLWIQLWPPLYAVINYIIHTTLQHQAEGIFAGLASNCIGLSFFTNIGLQHLQDRVINVSGYLYTLVPLISYALIKGGVHSFSHVAGSIMAPMQNAASSAAAEQVTGNYSFANTSFGQMSFENTTGFQSNVAPSISSGYFTDHQGSATKIYSPDEIIYKQANSDLRTQISSDDLISQGIQRNEQNAQSLVDSTQKTYLEGLSKHSRTTADLTEYLSNSNNYNENISTRAGYSVQESASYLQNVAENWGKQYGLDTKESLEGLVSASVGGEVGFFNWFSASAKASGSYGIGASRNEMFNAAQAVTSSESFQKHLQEINDFTKSDSFSSLQDEGAKFSSGNSFSLDEVQNSQTAYQAAYSQLQQVSENASWLKQNSQSIRQSLNQDFINWAQERFGSFSQVDEFLSKGTEADKQTVYQGFFDDVLQGTTNLTSPVKNANLASEFHNNSIKNLDPNFESDQLMKEASQAFNSGFSSKATELNIHDRKNNLLAEQSRFEAFHAKNTADLSKGMKVNRENSMNQFDDKNDQYLVERAAKHFFHKDNLSNKYRFVDQPAWMKGQE